MQNSLPPPNSYYLVPNTESTIPKSQFTNSNASIAFYGKFHYDGFVG
jgi:hypothetical protein